MFQQYWIYILTIVLSIAPVVFLAKVIWASHNAASSGNPRRIVTYLLGFAVLSVASVMILVWSFQRGLPLVSELFANNPATAAVADAGMQLTGAIDSGGFSLPGSGESGSFSFPSLPSLGGGSLSLPGVSVTATNSGPAVKVAPDVKLAPAAQALPVPTVGSTVLQMASSDWATYTVKRGDSMAAIARRYGVSVADLCGMNRSTVGGDCNRIMSGQTLKLPAANGQAPRELPQVAKPVYQVVDRTPVVVKPTPVPTVKAAVQSGAKTYTIQAGDTVYSIAAKFGGMTKVYAICTANRATLGDNCDNFQAGATIVIP